MEIGDYDRAVARVESAERVAPQMTYFHLPSSIRPPGPWSDIW